MTPASKIIITPDGTIDLSSLLGDLPSEFHIEVDGEYITLTKTWYLKGT